MSYWSMIFEFRESHPKAGRILVSVVWLQALVVAAMAVRRLVP